MEDCPKRQPTFILFVKMKVSRFSQKAKRRYNSMVFQVMPIDLTGSKYVPDSPELYDEHGAWFFFRMKDEHMEWPRPEGKLALAEARRMAKRYGVPLVYYNVPTGYIFKANADDERMFLSRMMDVQAQPLVVAH